MTIVVRFNAFDRRGHRGSPSPVSAGSSGTRVYRREGQTFELAGGAVKGIPEALSDSTGARWEVTDDFLVSATDPSERLPRLPSHVSFWFGWFAFHPDTLVYGEE